MANTIRIKRRASGASGAPSSLKNAELAYSEVDNILYYGKGSSGANGTATTIEAIGGPGAFPRLSTTRAANYVLAGPVSGSAAAATWRGLAAADIPDVSSTYLATAGGTIAGSLIVSGNFTVNGTQTVLNSTTMQVDDHQIELGTVSSPDDSTADQGGIVLKGTGDKQFTWLNSSDSWTSSEHLDLASGKTYKINGTTVLSGSSLGTGITGSSLTGLATISSGVWQGTAVAPAYGGTGLTTAVTGLLKGNGTSYSAATAGTDYLAADGEIDGGTY